MLDAQAVRVAQRILGLRAEAFALRRELPNPLNIGLNKQSEQPLVVQQALALLQKLGPDDLDTPLNKLGVPAVGIFRGDDYSYADRRDALIRGDLESGEPEAREAAA
jgi:hypothetical protein